MKVHIDGDVMAPKQTCQFLICELSALVGIKNFWPVIAFNRFSDGLETKKSASMVWDSRQESILRLYLSMTATKYMKPVHRDVLDIDNPHHGGPIYILTTQKI